MPQGKLFNVRIMPQTPDSAFIQREHGIAHTSYLEETAFFSLVQLGNTELVEQSLHALAVPGIVVGRLSVNSIRQMQYWAVCCITLGTRYAIQGGLDEMTAFHLSDFHIMQVDQLKTAEEIIAYLHKAVLDLTRLVRKNAHRNCPLPIRKCLQYIDQNLHKPIRLGELAKEARLSEDYLSKLFKQHVGKTASAYILEKKLDAAKAMLHGCTAQKEVAYTLGFCSQTYFITCFKKAFGLTPRQYSQYHLGMGE